MTRAMKQLYLTYAETRRLHGRERYTEPSRFLAEIPAQLLEDVRSPAHRRPIARGPATAPAPTGLAPPAGVKLGTRVRHAKFGDGTVLTLEGDGEYARVQVNFEDVGAKWLVLAYANLESL